VWASRLLRLSWPDNGEAGAEGQPPPGAFPKAFVVAFVVVIPMLAQIVRVPLAGRGACRSAAIDQLFSSDLIFLSNSSNEASPLITSPLMKKVGVEFTFSTSLAYF
jgi:hypothetical protein